LNRAPFLFLLRPSSTGLPNQNLSVALRHHVTIWLTKTKNSSSIVRFLPNLTPVMIFGF
jgi:hypothetical protein